MLICHWGIDLRKKNRAHTYHLDGFDPWSKAVWIRTRWLCSTAVERGDIPEFGWRLKNLQSSRLSQHYSALVTNSLVFGVSFSEIQRIKVAAVVVTADILQGFTKATVQGVVVWRRNSSVDCTAVAPHTLHCIEFSWNWLLDQFFGILRKWMSSKKNDSCVGGGRYIRNCTTKYCIQLIGWRTKECWRLFTIVLEIDEFKVSSTFFEGKLRESLGVVSPAKWNSKTLRKKSRNARYVQWTI